MQGIIKIALRTIKKSLGRYIAIFAIIALGVGFFSGLRVTKDAMVEAGNKYVDKHNLFDLRVISTYGFTDEDIEYFSEQRDVNRAEGAYSNDIIYKREDGSESVLRVHSITDGINGLDLIEGKMPSGINECVVDARAFDSSYIGRKIRLTDNNSEDVLKGLATKEFKIVGIVNSVYYMNFERGTTTVGSGSLSGFMYVAPEAFNYDRYTEMYVTMADGSYIYSEEYDLLLEEFCEDFEEICREYRKEQYDIIISSAKSALDDAKEQYEDGLKQYESEKSRLDGVVLIADTGVKALEKSYETAKNAFEYAKEQLEKSYAELQISREFYLSQLEILEKSEAEIDEMKASLDSAVSAYNTLKSETESKLAEGKKQLDDAKAEIEKGESELEALVRPEYYVLTRDTNTGYACFENDSSIVLGISKVFPVFFFMVAALVCVTTMSRMVTEQRGQTGTLKAMGYGDGQIQLIYAIYAGSAALLGCIFGFLLGSYAIPKIIWMVYDLMYGFAEIEFLFDPVLAAVSLLVSVLCSVGVAYVAVKKDLLEKPAALMRPKAPAKGKRIFFEKITFLWKRLGFLSKVSLRNIARYKVRFFMMILGVGGCMALLLTGFGIKDSITNVASDQFGGIMKYHCSVSFGGGLDSSELKEVRDDMPAGVEGSMFVQQSSVDVELENGSVKSAYLTVCEKNDIGDFISLHKGDREIEFPGKGEAVITKTLAEALSLSVGDRIEMRDSTMKMLEFEVSGICENFVNNYIYISPESYKMASGNEVKYNGCLLNAKYGKDVHQLAADFASKNGDVTMISVNSDVRNSIESMLESLNVIVYLVSICAAALAFIVIYNLTNLSITERQREIATLKVIGFKPGETSMYVFRENLLQSLCGIIAGLPLGMALHAFVMSQIKIDMVSFDVQILPLSFVVSVALTLIFAIVVDFALYPKIKSISMTDSLKSVE